MMNKICTRRCMAAIALVVIVGSAQPAAQGPSQPAAQDQRFAGWVVTPSITAGGGWDDNVLLANRGSNPPSDYTSPVGPGLSLDFTGKRTKFNSGYNGSFTFYRTIDELTSAEHQFRASFHHRVTPRISIVADESFSRAPTTDALQLAGVPFYRVGSYTNTAGGGVDVALSKFTTLTTRYSWRTVSFDFDQVARLALYGGDAHEAELALSRALSPRLSVTGHYSYLRGTLGEAARVTSIDERGNFQIQSGGASATYRLTPTVTILGGAGIARMTGSAPQLSLTDAALLPPTGAEVGPTVEAGVTWRGEHHLASIMYQRSFIPSFGFGGTFQNEEWIANLHVPFARNRAYADASFSWYDNEPLIVSQASLQTTWLSGKVGYRFNPWLAVEGYYDRSQQDAQVAGGNLDRNQVGFRIVAAKPMRLR